jgi:hypothetical protein
MVNQSNTISDELLRLFMIARIGSASSSTGTTTTSKAATTETAAAKSTPSALDILEPLTLRIPSLSVLKLLVQALHVAALHLRPRSRTIGRSGRPCSSLLRRCCAGRVYIIPTTVVVMLPATVCVLVNIAILGSIHIAASGLGHAAASICAATSDRLAA